MDENPFRPHRFEFLMTISNHFSAFLSLLLCIVLCVVFLGACSEEQDKGEQKQGQRQAPKVIVSHPVVKDIVEWDEYTGRFEAVERVDISARISGYLDEIRFTDGDIVQKGDILFVIDQRPLKIALDRAQAQLELALKELNRAKKLRADTAVSQEVVDRRLQEYLLAKAAVDEARLDLEYSEVKSPITGRIGEARVDIGNLVNGGEQNPTILTTVVSVDPMHFYFETSEAEHLKYLRLDRIGVRPGSDKTANPIFVKLLDEQDYNHRGEMDFVDNVIDRGTGTVEARAIFKNPDGLIYPGLFGRARVIGSARYEAILIPDDAILSDQTKKLVMTVDSEGKASPKFIETGPLRPSGMRIVRSGLSAKDEIIVNGLARVRPGVPVQSEFKQIEEPANPEDDVFPPTEFRPEHRDNGSSAR